MAIQKPIMIYNFKDDFVEVQMIGVKVPLLDVVGTTYKTISYADFVQLMESTLNVDNVVRETSNSEVEAIHRGMQKISKNRESNTVLFPKSTIGFKTEGDFVYVNQLLQGSQMFPNFKIIGLDNKVVPFDVGKYFVITKLKHLPNGDYKVENVVVQNLKDLMYVPKGNHQTEVNGVLSTVIKEKLVGKDFKEIHLLDTLEVLAEFNLNDIPDSNLKTALTQYFRDKIKVDWSVL